MVTIGRIQYANCTPIFAALSEICPAEEYTYVRGVPARLNQQLAAAAIDVCPSSSIEYALRPDRYLIIPDLSISSCGAVGSVMLLSRLPLEELHDKNVLLSAESATSVNLLKILLQLRYQCRSNFSVTDLPVEKALQQAPALLLIGDAALRATQAAAAPFVYDLGQLWYEWTGKPFVFALWLVSREAEKHKREPLRQLAHNLWQARTFAEQHLERIAEQSPDAAWMGPDQLLYYWRNNISYELGQEHIEGLKQFFHLASVLRLIPSDPELAFLDITS